MTDKTSSLLKTWSEDRFDPKTPSYIIDVKGKDYLKVNARTAWFVSDQRRFIADGVATHQWSIVTEMVEHDKSTKWAQFKTTITDVFGNSVDGYGSEDAKGFPDYLEKAETKSLGRALAKKGYGTMQAEELDSDGEDKRPVDSPVNRRGAKTVAKTPVTPAAQPEPPESFNEPEGDDEPEEEAEPPKKKTAPLPVAKTKPRSGVTDAQKLAIQALMRQNKPAVEWQIMEFHPNYANGIFFSNATQEDAQDLIDNFQSRLPLFNQAMQEQEDAAAEAEAAEEQEDNHATPERQNEWRQQLNAFKNKVTNAAGDFPDDPSFAANHFFAMAGLISQKTGRTWGKKPDLAVILTADELEQAFEILAAYDINKTPAQNGFIAKAA